MLEISADQIERYPVDIADDMVAVQSMPGRVSRRSLRLQRRGIKTKSATPARGRLANRRGAAGGEATGTAVYDFDDDSLDGAMLTPDGAAPPTGDAPMLATRERGPAQSPPRNAPLPPPEVTASALSVIVPVTGETVLYQQLLIEANQTQVVEIDARRRLRR